KFVPRGGPDGGDGGDGGDVILKPSKDIWDLRHFEDKQVFTSGDGGDGGKSKKNGKKGEDLIINVPFNTEVAFNNKKIIVKNKDILLLKGGEGGRGNRTFKNSMNQEPLLAEAGDRGQEINIELRIKDLPEVIIFGLSNSGKSYILNQITNAGTKEANYPFTTTTPIIAEIKDDIESIRVAEIPDFINYKKALEYSSFLNEAKVLIITINHDDDAIDTYKTINNIINAKINDHCSKILILNQSKEAPKHEFFSDMNQDNIFYVEKNSLDAKRLINSVISLSKINIKKNEPLKDDVFIHEPPIIKSSKTHNFSFSEKTVQVFDKKLVRVAKGSNLSKPEAQLQFHNLLNKSGYLKAFKDAGVSKGATIKFDDIEMEFK
ncbi:MAG: DUF1967 domain-containing protein, partial [Chloroflexota bacterium]|nr:DUF1967 domain-containing protein [Chloroflexota bacterium]